MNGERMSVEIKVSAAHRVVSMASALLASVLLAKSNPPRANVHAVPFAFGIVSL